MQKILLLPMKEDQRMLLFVERLQEGKIREFNEIFFYLTRTRIANYMGVSYLVFSRYYTHEFGRFRLEHFFKLAEKTGTDPWQLLRLFESQVKGKKRRR